MDYHIDNRVVLGTEREHKNLYSWSIKEFDQKGKQIGGDQIPWEWSSSFEVVELAATYGVQIKAGDDISDEQDQTQTVEITEALLESCALRWRGEVQVVIRCSGPSVE